MQILRFLKVHDFRNLLILKRFEFGKSQKMIADLI